jgi:hypothetical protein
MQNIIACIWDFDKTLIPGYMQEPLFAHYRVDPKKFWQEVAELPNYYRKCGLDMIASDTAYLNHILTYAREDVFKGLNNDILRKLGQSIIFYQGLPGFFDEVKQFVRDNPEYRRHEIRVEHYIVSTGLLQMILGSKIAPFIDGVWGCEFVESRLLQAMRAIPSLRRRCSRNSFPSWPMPWTTPLKPGPYLKSTKAATNFRISM